MAIDAAGQGSVIGEDVTGARDGTQSGPEVTAPMLMAPTRREVVSVEPDDDGWELLEIAWRAVRQKAVRLRARADELEAAADEWEDIMRTRRAHWS